MILFFPSYVDPLHLPSFPTRRSSDLHIEIRQRAVAADIVDLAIAALLQDRQDAAAMVVHIQPVADLHAIAVDRQRLRSEEHTSELQSRRDLVCRLLLEKKKKQATLHG